MGINSTSPETQQSCGFPGMLYGCCIHFSWIPYLQLADRYNRLNKQNEQLAQQHRSLQREIDALRADKEELSKKAADYDTLCRDLGSERVATQVRQIREREAIPRIHPVREQDIAI